MSADPGRGCHDIGGLHPAKFHQGILDLTREAGVAVFGRTPVTGVQRDGDEQAWLFREHANAGSRLDG